MKNKKVEEVKNRGGLIQNYEELKTKTRKLGLRSEEKLLCGGVYIY